MIFEAKRRIVFRQGEYESFEIEGRVVVDTEQDDVAESEAAQVLNDHLDDIVYPNVVDAAGSTGDENSYSSFYQKEIEERKKDR